MKHLRGFTIVEIIIVITVIGILAGIGIVSYSGMQARARDTERKADVDSMAAALETYYEQFGKYPSHATIADTTGGSFISQRGDGLRLPAAALTAPGDTSLDANYYSYTLDPTTTPSKYGYRAFQGTGTTQCAGLTDTCTRYELYYMLEQETGMKTYKSKFGNS